MSDIFCPRCGSVLNVSRDNAVDLHECPRCWYANVVPATSGYIRPEGPPGGWPEDLRFGSNYNDARRKP